MCCLRYYQRRLFFLLQRRPRVPVITITTEHRRFRSRKRQPFPRFIHPYRFRTRRNRRSLYLALFNMVYIRRCLSRYRPSTLYKNQYYD
ncbi:hypothetical protein P691DRAFT_72122 [Macrolepiota fuliginosa MF-IS2]|uniref:Uncharacterized protein n=1 Tax=Macrolepiota fuliginosa MF-IS2 TaxID=1400762 RepID=A0A9P5WYD1_9AGAR|nr:hypothetical protein P691DRAFT_72122 [Macrolepiota fuliginosa MF-IS2]